MLQPVGASVGERLEAFGEVLTYQGERPPEGDHFIGAFCVAMSDALVTLPGLEDRYCEILQRREDKGNSVSSSALVRMSVAAIQKQLLRNDPNYPRLYGFPYRWQAAFADIIEPSDPMPLLTDEFSFDLAQKRLQSNVPERYKGVKLPLLFYGHRFGDKPAIVDVGCSVNHGLKKLASKEELLRFRHVGVLPFDADLTNPRINRRMSRVVNRALDQEVVIVGVGVDPWPQRDKENNEWVKSCSFYPSELLNRRRRYEYDALEALADPGITRIEADFTDVEPDRLYDMATFSTVLYQFREHPEKREDMLSNARRHLQPGGILVVQDFVQLDPHDPLNLVFPDNFHEEPYGYRTLIYDMAQPELGFQEFIRWENGRCTKMMWGDSDIARAAQKEFAAAA